MSEHSTPLTREDVEARTDLFIEPSEAKENRLLGALTLFALPVVALFYVIVLLTLFAWTAAALRGALDALNTLF